MNVDEHSSWLSIRSDKSGVRGGAPKAEQYLEIAIAFIASKCYDDGLRRRFEDHRGLPPPTPPPTFLLQIWKNVDNSFLAPKNRKIGFQ